MLLERIKEIQKESKGRYGSPKIHKHLQKEGYSCSIKRGQRLIKEAGIQSNIMKKYRPTPSQTPVKEHENVRTTTSMNEKWVADITYIHTLRDD